MSYLVYKEPTVFVRFRFGFQLTVLAGSDSAGECIWPRV